MITLCQFGAGRIGAIHAANAAAHPAVRLRYIVDVQSEAASALAARHGAEVCEPDKALRDQQVNAVLIASSTDTHADLLEAAARAGKAIFCEKPIDLSLARVDACLREVARCKVPLLVGFNRRHDPNFKALHTALAAGEAGKLEMVSITSRDPAPPPLEYVKVSGGLFRDMMIHDFDMARWLLPEEPCEVMAMASCLVDSSIGEAGDVDTAMVTLKTPGGVLCHIGNSRRAVDRQSGVVSRQVIHHASRSHGALQLVRIVQIGVGQLQTATSQRNHVGVGSAAAARRDAQLRQRVDQV